MTSAATTKPESAPLLSALGCIISPPKYQWFIPDPSRLGAGSSVGSGHTFPPMLQEGRVIGKVSAADELGAQARKWSHGGECVPASHPSPLCLPRGRSSPGILGTISRDTSCSLVPPAPDLGSKVLCPLSPHPHPDFLLSLI